MMIAKLKIASRAALLAAAASGMVSSCSSDRPQQVEVKQVDDVRMAATYAKNKTKYHTLKVLAPTYEMRDLMVVELKASGFDVVNGEVAELPSGMWGVREGTSPSPFYGAKVTANIVESKDAQVTNDAAPSYLPDGEQGGNPAFKTQVAITVNDAGGNPVKTYTGWSKAGDSWSLRSSETSALREALRAIPPSDKLDW